MPPTSTGIASAVTIAMFPRQSLQSAAKAARASRDGIGSRAILSRAAGASGQTPRSRSVQPAKERRENKDISPGRVKNLGLPTFLTDVVTNTHSDEWLKTDGVRVCSDVASPRQWRVLSSGAGLSPGTTRTCHALPAAPNLAWCWSITRAGFRDSGRCSAQAW